MSKSILQEISTFNAIKFNEAKLRNTVQETINSFDLLKTETTDIIKSKDIATKLDIVEYKKESTVLSKSLEAELVKFQVYVSALKEFSLEEMASNFKIRGTMRKEYLRKIRLNKDEIDNSHLNRLSYYTGGIKTPMYTEGLFNGTYINTQAESFRNWIYIDKATDKKIMYAGKLLIGITSTDQINIGDSIFNTVYFPGFVNIVNDTNITNGTLNIVSKDITDDSITTNGHINIGGHINSVLDITTSTGDLKSTLGELVVNTGVTTSTGGFKALVSGGLEIAIGEILTKLGDITTHNGNIITLDGYIRSSNGLQTLGGNIINMNGDIIATKGDIKIIDGDLIITKGDIKLEDGSFEIEGAIIAKGGLDIEGGAIIKGSITLGDEAASPSDKIKIYGKSVLIGPSIIGANNGDGTLPVSTVVNQSPVSIAVAGIDATAKSVAVSGGQSVALLTGNTIPVLDDTLRVAYNITSGGNIIVKHDAEIGGRIFCTNIETSAGAKFEGGLLSEENIVCEETIHTRNLIATDYIACRGLNITGNDKLYFGTGAATFGGKLFTENDVIVDGDIILSGDVYAGSVGTVKDNTANGTFYGTAFAANYADLAENYLADKLHPVGTVMSFGIQSEMTLYNPEMPLMGVISMKPALRMNEKSKHETEPFQFIALAGRVPVLTKDMDIKRGMKIYPDSKNLGCCIGSYIKLDKEMIGISLGEPENGFVEVKI